MTQHKNGLNTRIAIVLGARQPGQQGKDGTGRWADLEEAIEGNFRLAEGDAIDHRHVAPDQVLMLAEIVLHPESEAMREVCAEFIREFPEARTRVCWIQRLWRDALHFGIDRGGLKDVRLEEARATDLLEQDAYQRALDSDAEDGLAVDFIGDWIDQPSDQPSDEEVAPVAPRATLLIRDESAMPRVEQLFDDAVTLGREGTIMVNGRYASRQHARLYFEGDKLFVVDMDSDNGLWLGENRIKGNTPVAVRDKAELRLGAVLSDPCPDGDCPRITVTLHTCSSTSVNTPVRSQSQPGNPASAQAPSRCTLTLTAGGWNDKRTLSRLPCTIGRAAGCDIVTPDTCIAVSRQHMRLLDMDADGVWVEDLNSTRGSFLGGEERKGRFLLHWNEALTLGGADVSAQHNPVRLVATPCLD